MRGYCYRRSSVVYMCLFVGHVCQPCENGSTDRGADWSVNSGGFLGPPEEPLLDGVDIPHGKGTKEQFWVFFRSL